MYSELIYMINNVEQTNELFLKNHDLRLTGTSTMLEVNHDNGKKLMRKLDDNLCNHCGLTRYWSRIYCTPKYFVDLY